MEHWLWVHFGISGAGPWYAFWSGSGSDVGELPLLIAALMIIRKANCHAKGCYRVGLHHVSGTHYITCRKHHPVHDGSAPATADQIAQAYADANRSAPGLVDT